MTELPAGLTVRSPLPSDTDAILRLAVAYFTRVLGQPMVTLTGIQEALSAPTFTPEQDSWLVLDGAGAVAGFGFVLLSGERRFIPLTVITPDPAVAGWLLATGTERARAAAGEHGNPEAIVQVGVFRADEGLRDAVSAAGFEFATSFLQLRIDHSAPLSLPEPPAGTKVHVGAFDESARRAAHAALSAAFEGQDSAALPPYEEWLEAHERSTLSDWSQLTMIERDGRVLAASDRSSNFVETENCGYVGRLGVRAEARGLGLAKYLLRHAFATDAAAGRAGTILHVDTSNPTPALGLYESVGMRTVRVADNWDKRVPTP